MKYFNTVTKAFSYEQKPEGKFWVSVLLIENKPKDYPESFYAQVGDAVFDEEQIADIATYELIAFETLKAKHINKNATEHSKGLPKIISFLGVNFDINTKKDRDRIKSIKGKSRKFKANKDNVFVDLTPQNVADLQDLLDEAIKNYDDNEFNGYQAISNLANHQALADYLQNKNGG